MATILILDDDTSVRFALTEIVEALGHVAVAFADPVEGLGSLEDVSVVITDYVMPEMTGMQVLEAVRAERPEVPVILITARGSERLAVDALKGGAYDYLPKPFDLDVLEHALARALEAVELRQRALVSSGAARLKDTFVAESPALRAVLRAATRVAPRDLPVLVTGPTGVGKEVVAEWVHVHSGRANAPFVRFNCAAIHEGLAESELFGHVRGAFTGASEARLGFFREADGGTIVLDEVGELPLSLQAKLLRTLQQGEVQPVGSSTIHRVDVRIVACTNRDLRAASSTGEFREDLYYRLNVIELAVPPLSQRHEDLRPLIEAFRLKYMRRFEIDRLSFEPALYDQLEARVWPGNVRELENAVARLVAMSHGPVVRVAELSPDTSSLRPMPSGSLKSRVAAFERTLLAEAMAGANGNQSEAARALGVSRSTLIDKLKRHDLS